MAEKLNEKLFQEFCPNTLQEWKDKVVADLKGADFDRKLVWKTNEGFSVQPMFRREDREKLAHLDCLPGEFPFVRGNKKDSNDWFVRQDISVGDFADANKKALDILNKGITSLGFVFEECRDFSEAGMEVLLKDIELECIEVNFVSPCNKLSLLKAFKEVVEERGNIPENIYGGINADPLSDMAREGKIDENGVFADMAEAFVLMKAYRNFKLAEVGGYVFNDCGASVVQELGFSLAAGLEYMDRLTEKGFTADAVAPRIRFHFATGSKYFMEIAKLRAARYIWAHMIKAYNPGSDAVCMMHIHGETSRWNKTLYDSNVNMLRTQTETMAAVLGGVDSFSVNPYDAIFRKGGEFSERIARNQQLLLKEESHFSKIADVAGGSYYIEELTDLIIDAAWKLFSETEAEGGYIAAFRSGYVQKAVKAMAEARDKAVAERKENLLGTNQFPDFSEILSGTVDTDIPYAEENRKGDFETLTPCRGGSGFEKMRLRTERYAVGKGRPKVYMFPMGNLAMRKARAQFACNFFACAGFDTVDNNGFDTVDEGVKAALEYGADIVVLCSSDDEYAGFAPEAFDKLKNAAIVVVAGNPVSRPELEERGITDFIHVKNNVLEELTGYQKKLGIND